MTRLEFTARFEAVSRKQAFQPLAFFVSLLFISAAASWIERHYRTGSFIEIGMISLLLSGLLWLAWSGFRLPRKNGLVCPDCRLSLDGKNGQHALVTGNCKRCGKPVFNSKSSQDELPPHRHRLSRTEFISNLKALERKETRHQVAVLIIGVAIVIGSIPLVKHVHALAESGSLDGAKLLWLGVGTAVLVGAAFLALMGVFLFAALGKLKHPGVPCPYCDRSLRGNSGRFAIATGKCMFCEGEIFEPASGASARLT